MRTNLSNSIFIKRIVLNNYKSIKECSVDLGPLTFLVGQNGVGKSNFLDALRLVSDSLNTSIEQALRDRGGINEVRRRSSGHPAHFGIRLDWKLSGEKEGIYAFRVGSQPGGGFGIQREECHVFKAGNLEGDFYRIENGKLIDLSFKPAPPVIEDRLFLVSAGGLPAFRPLFDALSHMGFYSLNPDEIRELQPPDTGEILKRDGSNMASVLNSLEKTNPEIRKLIVNYLSKVAPGIQDVEVKHFGKKETIEFRQSVGTNSAPWRFMAESMSDGTLRALGVLTALFQAVKRNGKRVPLVGIEEPEVAVHPGAAGVLRDGLRGASKMTQVIVTSHSPDLLDDKEINAENILAVVNTNGETELGPLDNAGRTAIRNRLYTAGELLRLNQIEPDKAAAKKITPFQLDLFNNYKP